MEPIQIIGLCTIGASLIAGVATQLGRWIERQIQAAEYREQARQWREEVAPQIDPWDEHDWPPAGQASVTFFGTDYVRYDPEEDARAYMDRQDRELQEFVQRLREH